MNWTHKNLVGDGETNAKCWFAEQATAKGCWIYSKDTKMWYTPTEFVFSRETVNYNKGVINTRHLIMKTPKQILLEAIDIAKRSTEYVDFIYKKINAQELK